MTINSKVTFNNAHQCPILGLGTYLSHPGKETEIAVEFALSIGYRHIDTAALYGNEKDVGKVVLSSEIPRPEIFITTKLWNSDQGYDSTFKAFDKSLNKLKLDYVDLYLMHWPVKEHRRPSWKAMQEIYESGRAKSIGVSNFTIRHMKELLNYSEIVPVVNQVEFSPFLYQKELLDFCLVKGIFIESYSPLTRTRKFNDPNLISISEKYGKSPSQILIRWALQIGTITLPKSVNSGRIRENADVFDFEIMPEDMIILNSLNENFRVAWDPSQLD
jgi:methylglyoxal/glyoxal reductase